MNLYYQIWADAIGSSKKKNTSLSVIMLGLSFIQSSHIMIIYFLFIVTTNIKIPIFIDFHFLPFEALNKLLSFFTSLILPFITINYFLVFYKKKYEKILKKDKSKDGVLVIKYVFISAGIFILPLIIGKIISG
jgi:hypothetical protein